MSTAVVTTAALPAGVAGERMPRPHHVAAMAVKRFGEERNAS
jgi:hypothetical protein